MVTTMTMMTTTITTRTSITIITTIMTMTTDPRAGSRTAIARRSAFSTTASALAAFTCRG